MSSLSKYGSFLNLIGGILVYISKTVYPVYTEEGLILNKDEYRTDLKNVINLGESSIQIIENAIPPSFLKDEHDLFFRSYKNVLDCIYCLNIKLCENYHLELSQETLTESLSSLKNVEDEFKVASMKVVEKVMLLSRR